MRNKVTAIFFIVFIFFLSINTVWNMKDKLDNIWKGSVEATITNVDSALQENVAQRNRFINVNGLFLRSLGITYVKDAGGIDTYKLDNGQIMYRCSKQDVNEYVDHLEELKQYLEESNNGELLYVQLPFKIESEEVMPVGASDYSNDNADRLLEGLDKKEIENVDVRQWIKEEKTHSELFFNTDHHWKPETAFWAAGKISEYLSKNYGFEYDSYLYDMSNYNVTTYRNWFLGSIGKRVGNWYAGADDFDLIVPKFYTNFAFEAETSSGHIERNGSFEEVMIDKEKLKKNYFDINTYVSYIGGDFAFNRIHNNVKKNGQKILLLRESFSCTLLPFLSMGIEDITAIDLRHYDEMSLKELLDKNKFDLVVIAYNPSGFSEETFNFFD